MNRKRVVDDSLRAKALRPADSGVSHAVHCADEIRDTKDPHPATGQTLTPQERQQRQIKALARRALEIDGLAHADIAAAANVSRPLVSASLEPDGKTINSRVLIALGVLSPTFAACMVEWWRSQVAR